MLDQTLLKLVKHDNAYSIAEFVCLLLVWKVPYAIFFTVESTAQTACVIGMKDRHGDPIIFPVCTIIMQTRCTCKVCIGLHVCITCIKVY